MSPEEIIEFATEYGLTVATAESCTGGRLAAALTDVPGASAVFTHGIVTYSNGAKQQLLNVPSALIDAHGAVSNEVAEAMATGVRMLAGADIGISVTGIAGPGGSEFKPEGRVCFGLATDSDVRSETIEFGALGRGRVRRAATLHALSIIGDILEHTSPK